MAFPQVQDRLSQNWATATNPFNVNMPSTVASGDLLFIFFNVNDGVNVADPSGWTNLHEDASGALRGVLYAKTADGTEGGTQVTITPNTAEEGAAIVYRITDWGGTVGTDVDFVTSGEANASTIVCPEVTAGWGSADNLFLAVGYAGNDDATINETPANYTDKTEVQAGGGVDAGCTVVSMERELAAASDEPNASGQTYSYSMSEGEDRFGVTIVVEPGTSGGDGGASGSLPLMTVPAIE